MPSNTVLQLTNTDAVQSVLRPLCLLSVLAAEYHVRRLTMKTELDSGRSWYLERLWYADELQLVVVEAFRSPEAESIQIGSRTVDGLHAIEIAGRSRRFTICFARLVAWQLVNESFTAFDNYEERDSTGFVQILTKSRYLDYVNANHGWYADVIGPAKHYRVWTEDEVLDVVALDAPSITLNTGA